MAPYWQPGVQYSYGDVVEYEGAEYQIVQPHFSQGDWPPSMTPALWGRHQGGGDYENKYGEENPQYAQQQPHMQRMEADQFPQQEQEEEEQSWFERHKSEIGMAAGALAAGGGAALLINHFQGRKEEEEE